MKNKVVRRVLLAALTAVMLAGVPGTVQAAGTLGEGSQVVSHYSGNNVEKQNYSRWSSPMSSYLEPLSDGRFMRVQYTKEITNGEVFVEYYDADFHLTKTQVISEELPLFGGFYASGSNYYLLTGQRNPTESASVEVFRITKYDLNWKRLGSVGVFDCNTVIPFGSTGVIDDVSRDPYGCGTARMDMSGKYLLIRTSHQMYKAADRLNHQANVTMQIDTEQMKITDSYTAVANSAYGYVSHSFNQFIKLEDNHIIAVDHGDAYPRSIALLKYPTDISQGKFVPSYPSRCEMIDVLEFPGAIGENATGASVGGFEISDSAYLVAGNSVVQDEQNLTRSTRNIFVASVDKQTNGVSIKWLTNYAEGTKGTSTPQMVAINKNRYMVLWSEQGKVCYTLVDGNGNKIGNIYSMEGNLSDCAPVVANGKVVWYVWNEEWLNFYQIDIRDISKHSVKERLYGHEVGEPKVRDGILGLDCCRCNTILPPYQSIIQDYYIYWGGEWVAEYAEPFWRHNYRKVGDKISCSFVPTSVSNESYTCNLDFEVLISNPKIVSWMEEGKYQNMAYGTFTMLSSGQATVTIRPKWNPSLEKKYVFTVKGTGETGGSEETGGTEEKKSGLHNDNGTWRYYVNGKVDTTYTGLCEYGGGWYYVQNGVVNFKATGLCQYGKDWYFVQNGAVNFKATGLWNQFGSWWYVENGKVDLKATGLCQYGNSWYFVQNGAVNLKATGLWNQFGCWWYVENGAVNFKATGLWNQFGNWWYVENGAVNFKATGLWNQFGSWWYVENGAVNFKYNGQVPYGNAYYNVVNGRVVF